MLSSGIAASTPCRACMPDQAAASLRSIDGHLARLLTDQTSGRETAVQEVRSEIRLLARMIAALAEGEEPR